MKNFFLKIWIKFIFWLSHVRISKYPFFVFLGGRSHLIKPRIYLDVITKIQPGDIILRAFDGYLDSILIPGKWNHSGVYIGEWEIDGKKYNHVVAHALGDGVRYDHLLDFMQTDHIKILRYPKMSDAKVKKIKKKAKTIIVDKNTPYDYLFELDDNKLYCHEFTAVCLKEVMPNFDKIIKLEKTFLGTEVYLAKSFLVKELEEVLTIN